MKRTLSKVQEPDSHFYQDSKSHSNYAILNHEAFEVQSIAYNPNTLNFTDPKLNKKLTKTLYIDPISINKPSKEFKSHLIVFYIFLNVLFLILISFAIVMRYSDQIPESIMNFHVIFIVLLWALAHALLYALYKIRIVLEYNCYFFAILAFLLYIYLILGNEPVISSIFGVDSTKVKLPTSLAIICVTVFVRIILFDSFFVFAILSFAVLLVYIAINFGLSQDPISAVLAEFCLIGCFLILQVIDTQLVDIRKKQLFWRLTCEEKFAEAFEKAESSNLQRRNSAETIANRCENIKNEINYVCSVLLYQDLRKRLKGVLTDINIIEKSIEMSHLEYFKIEPNKDMDSEDKEFISQNYLSVKNMDVSRRRRKSATVMELPEGKIGSIFKNYGVKELESVLSSVGKNWNFDIWFIFNTTGHSIQVMAKYLFKKWNLSELICTSKPILESFFRQIEQGYKENPYHNACHAADVCHTLLYFILQSDLSKKISQHDSIVSIIAALGHDLGHPGVTNRFLINNRDPLAIEYNDISVLESMHSSCIFKIMGNPDSDIFAKVKTEDWTHMRKLMIEMILETDMSRHFEILGKFKAKSPTTSLESLEDKIIVLGMGLKCADIGHSAKSTVLHEFWTKLVCEEFFKQGDIEKEKGQSVSMYCDRQTTDIAKSQAGFIKNICIPLYDIWCGYLDSELVLENCLMQLDTNFKHWDAKHKERKGSAQPPQRMLDLPLLNPSSSAREIDE